MLQPIIAHWQDPQDANKLRLDDLTPAYAAGVSPGGYGSPNIARSDVDFVVLRLTAPDETKWSTDTLSWKPTSVSLAILSSDFTPYISADAVVNDLAGCLPLPIPSGVDGCCANRSDFTFTDGLYSLTYEVWGRTGIPAQITSYHLALTLCEHEQVWATRQGAWVNITAEGQLKNRYKFSWSKLDTVLVYDFYEVRLPLGANTYRVSQSGFVQKVVTPDASGAMTTSSDPILVGAATIRFMLTGVVDGKIARLLNRPLGDIRSEDFACDALGYLSVAGQQLDTLKVLKLADEYAPVILAEITENVSYLETQLLYPTVYARY